MTLNPQQFLYHETSPVHRESIRSNGLRPDEDESNGVWFFSDRSRVHQDAHTDVWRARAADVPNLEHGSAWSAEWNEGDPVHATGEPVQKVQRVKIRRST
jgi:hypothetical protein